MKAKLIINNTEIEVEISDEELKKLEEQTIKTGYERAIGQVAYYVNYKGDVEGDMDVGEDIDNECYECGNYYSSKIVAENNARADKLMRHLRRFAAEHRDGNINYATDVVYEICYTKKDGLNVECIFDTKYVGSIAFTSRESAESAVDKFRTELLWYFTEYKDSL